MKKNAPLVLLFPFPIVTPSAHAVVLVLELLFMGHSVRAAAVRHPQKDVGGSGVGLPERLPAQGFRGHGEPNNLICQLVRRRLVLFLYSEMAFDRWSCCG